MTKAFPEFDESAISLKNIAELPAPFDGTTLKATRLETENSWLLLIGKVFFSA